MRRETVICASLLLLVHSGCCRRGDTTAPNADTRGRLRVGWIHPSPTDSVIADTIRIELSVAGEDAEGLVITAGDSTLCETLDPPWRIDWLPSGSPRTIRLRAATEEAQAPERVLRWSPNCPPSVEIIELPRSGGLVRAPGESLRAAVSDPEDGGLEGNAIAWISDVQGLVGFGGTIPTESLVPGRHRIRARGTDRWGRSTTVERAIEAFDPSERTTPERALEALRCAMLTADTQDYRQGIAPEFRFLLCPAEREADPTLPEGWDYEAESAFGERLHCLARAEWSISSVQSTVIAEEGWAKAEIDKIAIDLDSGSDQPLSIRNGRARLFLHRSAGYSEWKIYQWNDLGAEGLSYGRARLILAAWVEIKTW